MSELLRLRVADYGAWFATRHGGREVRMAAIHLLAQNEQATTIVLDFDDVQGLTNGCADEMVAMLVLQQDDRTIRVEGANDEVRDSIATALARRGLPAPSPGRTTDG